MAAIALRVVDRPHASRAVRPHVPDQPSTPVRPDDGSDSVVFTLGRAAAQRRRRAILRDSDETACHEQWIIMASPWPSPTGDDSHRRGGRSSVDRQAARPSSEPSTAKRIVARRRTMMRQISAHVARGDKRGGSITGPGRGVGQRCSRQPARRARSAHGAPRLRHDTPDQPRQQINVGGRASASWAPSGWRRLPARWPERAPGAIADVQLRRPIEVDRRRGRRRCGRCRPDVEEQQQAVGVGSRGDLLPVLCLRRGDGRARGDAAIGAQAVGVRPGAPSRRGSRSRPGGEGLRTGPLTRSAEGQQCGRGAGAQAPAQRRRAGGAGGAARPGW